MDDSDAPGPSSSSVLSFRELVLVTLVLMDWSEGLLTLANIGFS